MAREDTTAWMQELERIGRQRRGVRSGDVQDYSVVAGV